MVVGLGSAVVVAWRSIAITWRFPPIPAGLLRIAVKVPRRSGHPHAGASAGEGPCHVDIPRWALIPGAGPKTALFAPHRAPSLAVGNKRGIPFRVIGRWWCSFRRADRGLVG